ncbi:MAG: hypothetical protein C4B58_12630 [Deltaproteobacteria bacterium]|nr:MAG: hypothetical protein C4B58_12630 [Deltaproteobacteria bacterium]
MAAPRTELESVSEDLERVLDLLDSVTRKTTVMDSIRTFDFLDPQYHDFLQRGLVEAANKMAAELEFFVNADPKGLSKLIACHLDVGGILPDSVKKYNVPCYKAFKKYARENLDDLRKIWETQDRNLLWAHVYMIQQEPLYSTVVNLFKQLNVGDKSKINEFLHAYFRKAINELLSNMASSQFYSPTYHRSRLYLQRQKMVFASKTAVSNNSEDPGPSQKLPFGILSPSLNLMGLWAISNARSKGIKEPNRAIKEILEESSSHDSNNDVMQKIKDFRKALTDYIYASQSLKSETQKNEFSNKHKKIRGKVHNLVEGIRKDSSFKMAAKCLSRDISHNPISMGDIVSILATSALIDPTMGLFASLRPTTDKLIMPAIRNVSATYCIRRNLRSILDDMDLADKTIQGIFE